VLLLFIKVPLPPEIALSPYESLYPAGNDATLESWRPVVRLLIVVREDSTARYSTDDPSQTVQDGIGSDTRNKTISNAESEGHQSKSEESRD
jgi:hypothetical protein